MRIYLDNCCFNRPYDDNKENFDYTKWQRTLFDDMTFDEMHSAAVDYAREHPFKMNRK